MVHILDEGDEAVGHACVTRWVHARIAAADVICCARLGEWSRGESHADAVDLLQRAEPSQAMHLERWLGLKTKAGYSSRMIGASDRARAQRACEALPDFARGL